MTFRLVISPAANRDIDEVMNWYDSQRETLGTRFIQALQTRFDEMTSSPFVPRVIPGSRLGRVILSGWPYMIYYRIVEETIRVIAIIHTSRDPAYIRSRIS